MVEDLVASLCFKPGYTDPESVDRLLEDRCGSVSRGDWAEQDRLETAADDILGRFYVKSISTESMQKAFYC